MTSAVFYSLISVYCASCMSVSLEERVNLCSDMLVTHNKYGTGIANLAVEPAKISHLCDKFCLREKLAFAVVTHSCVTKRVESKSRQPSS